jgi:hypothetical protein
MSVKLVFVIIVKVTNDLDIIIEHVYVYLT